MSETRGRVLLIEDDHDQLTFLRTVLEADGWTVLPFESGAEGVASLDRGEDVDVAISDLMMPGMDGRAVLEAMLERHPEVPVIILTAHATVDSAVELLQAGAHHYLAKPAKIAELRIAVQRAKESTETRRELARLRRRVQLPADVVGVSRPIQEVLEIAIRIAPTMTPVLITGEPGTGKEIVARAIHAASGRAAFVAFNCAAIPPSQFESELFGHRRASGAAAVGVVDAAAAGTLFLDEVAEVPLALQPSLLRLVGGGDFRRVGDTEPTPCTARFITATSRDPEQQVREGRMLEDLLYQLSAVRLHLPPLRERPVDIPALAESLLRRLAERYQLDHADLSPEALTALTAYRWPGNARELESVLARALALRSGHVITPRDLPPHVAKAGSHGGGATTAPSLTLQEVERRHILAVLQKTGGNKLKASEILGIDRSTLHRKLKQIQGFAALKL